MGSPDTIIPAINIVIQPILNRVLAHKPADVRVIPSGIEVVEPDVLVEFLAGKDTLEVLLSKASRFLSEREVFVAPDLVSGAVCDLDDGAEMVRVVITCFNHIKGQFPKDQVTTE